MFEKIWTKLIAFTLRNSDLLVWGFNGYFVRLYFKCDFYNSQVMVHSDNLDSGNAHINFLYRSLSQLDWVPRGWGQDFEILWIFKS